MWRSRCDGEDPLAPLWWKCLGTIEKSSKNPWELRFWLEKKQEKTHRFEGELMFLFRNVFFSPSMGLCSANFNGNVVCEGFYSFWTLEHKKED